MSKIKPRPSGRLKAKLAKEKSWAKLGLTRAKYESDVGTMNASRTKFEEMLEAMLKEALEMPWEKAKTEVHE